MQGQKQFHSSSGVGSGPSSQLPDSEGQTSGPHFFGRDVRALGITLMGHQKKILGSIQTMRAQLSSTQGPRRHL